MEKILAGLTNKEDIGILIADVITGFIFANTQICDYFGYTKNELFGFVHLTTLMDHDDPDGKIDQYVSVWDGSQKKVKINHRFIKKGGSLFQADLEIEGKEDSEGRSVLLFCFSNVVDLDDTVEPNDEADEDQLVQDFELDNNKAILIFTSKLGLMYTNKAADHAFGYKKTEMHGSIPPQAFVGKGSLVSFVKNSLKVYSGFSKEESFDCNFITKAGEAFSAHLAISKRKEGGTKYLIMQIDI